MSATSGDTLVRLTQIILTIAGGALLVLSAYLYQSSARFERRSLSTRGVVLALVEGPNHADIRFTDKRGTSHVYHENGARRALAVREAVPVRYLPNDPAGTARIDSLPGIYGTARTMLWLGLVLVVAAAVFPWLQRRFPSLVGVRGQQQ